MSDLLWQESQREAEATIGHTKINLAKYLGIPIEYDIQELTEKIYDRKMRQGR